MGLILDNLACKSDIVRYQSGFLQFIAIISEMHKITAYMFVLCYILSVVSTNKQTNTGIMKELVDDDDNYKKWVCHSPVSLTYNP